jgi:hypothetical protein
LFLSRVHCCYWAQVYSPQLAPLAAASCCRRFLL